jgi:hypothetical protein
MSEKSKQFRIFLKTQKDKGKVQDIPSFPSIFTEPEKFIQTYREILLNISVNEHETTVKLIQDYFLASENFLKENNYNIVNLFKSQMIEFLTHAFDHIFTAKDVMMIFINLAKSKKFEILAEIINFFHDKSFKYVSFSEMIISDTTQDLISVLSENLKNEFVQKIFQQLCHSPSTSKRVEEAIHQFESSKIIEKFNNFLKLKFLQKSDFELVEKLVCEMNFKDINEILFHFNNGFNFINYLIELKNKKIGKI